MRAMTAVARDSREATTALISCVVVLICCVPVTCSADMPRFSVPRGNVAQGSAAGLQLYADFMQCLTPSLSLAAAALCSVLSKQFSRYTGGSQQDSELGGAVAATLLSLIEHEPDLRARAAFTFGEGSLRDGVPELLPISDGCPRGSAYHVADEPHTQQRAVAAQCFNIFRPFLASRSAQENPYPTHATLEEQGRVREVCPR